MGLGFEPQGRVLWHRCATGSGSLSRFGSERATGSGSPARFGLWSLVGLGRSSRPCVPPTPVSHPIGTENPTLCPSFLVPAADSLPDYFKGEMR